MKKETIEQIKKDLLNRKSQIEKDLAIMDGGEKELGFPEYGDKSDENAQEVGEYVTNLATKDALESTLRDINGALERIEKGDYGVCKYCKSDIGEKRMQARPVASACIDCKTKLQNS